MAQHKAALIAKASPNGLSCSTKWPLNTTNPTPKVASTDPMISRLVAFTSRMKMRAMMVVRSGAAQTMNATLVT